MRYDFLLETYDTERLKTLSVWSQVPDEWLDRRLEPRARTPREQMVHQCVSEDGWMKNMLGIELPGPAVPAHESKLSFLTHYAAAACERLKRLQAQPETWFEEHTKFFGDDRSRAWVLTRRIAHSAHHRGQLTALLRVGGRDLYSTYGPTADTGGLPQHQAAVIYRYPDVAALLEAEAYGGDWPPLPGASGKPVTERPD